MLANCMSYTQDRVIHCWEKRTWSSQLKAEVEIMVCFLTLGLLERIILSSFPIWKRRNPIKRSKGKLCCGISQVNLSSMDTYLFSHRKERESYEGKPFGSMNPRRENTANRIWWKSGFHLPKVTIQWKDGFY